MGNPNKMKATRTTMIRITPETRRRLREYGKKSETYDQAIIRALNEVEKHERKK